MAAMEQVGLAGRMCAHAAAECKGMWGARQCICSGGHSVAADPVVQGPGGLWSGGSLLRIGGLVATGSWTAHHGTELSDVGPGRIASWPFRTSPATAHTATSPFARWRGQSLRIQLLEPLQNPTFPRGKTYVTPQWPLASLWAAILKSGPAPCTPWTSHPRTGTPNERVACPAGQTGAALCPGA